jgi:vacuole morphology and inheritance protein 14
VVHSAFIILIFLPRQIRECHLQGDQRRISQIIDQLVEMFNNGSNPLHIRNGGLIGLAGTAIALGVDIAPYMEKFVEPLLICFSDPENRIRYFSAECLYNIAKVSKGEVLVYFNPIFDALSKVGLSLDIVCASVISSCVELAGSRFRIVC